MDNIDFKDDDFYDVGEDSFSFEPQQQDSSTFKQRNDPEPLLYKFRLELMNCYEKEESYIDEAGTTKTRKKVLPIKNTNPRANKEGIEDIISYMRTIINNHTVQGNIINQEEYRLKMRHISKNITQHFIACRIEWGVDFNYIDLLIVKAIRLADIFLTRLLENKEREGYGLSYKENTERKIQPREKESIVQKATAFLLGRPKRY